jgi:hypothetical protein
MFAGGYNPVNVQRLICVDIWLTVCRSRRYVLVVYACQVKGGCGVVAVEIR